MNSRTSLALACALASVSVPGFASVMDFDDVPITATMINSPSHTDAGTSVAPLNDFTAGGEFTDLAFGSYNGMPVANAWSGTTAANIRPADENGLNQAELLVRSNNGGFFGLANVRVYAPAGSEGAILNINAYDLQGDNSPGPPVSFWYANVVIPAAQPGRSPWVFVQLPTPENYGELFSFDSNAPIFLDHLQLEPIPEPGTWALLGLGLAGLMWRQWRRNTDRHGPTPTIA